MRLLQAFDAGAVLNGRCNAQSIPFAVVLASPLARLTRSGKQLPAVPSHLDCSTLPLLLTRNRLNAHRPTHGGPRQAGVATCAGRRGPGKRVDATNTSTTHRRPRWQAGHCRMSRCDTRCMNACADSAATGLAAGICSATRACASLTRLAAGASNP